MPPGGCVVFTGTCPRRRALRCVRTQSGAVPRDPCSLAFIRSPQRTRKPAARARAPRALPPTTSSSVPVTAREIRRVRAARILRVVPWSGAVPRGHALRLARPARGVAADNPRPPQQRSSRHHRAARLSRESRSSPPRTPRAASPHCSPRVGTRSTAPNASRSTTSASSFRGRRARRRTGPRVFQHLAALLPCGSDQRLFLTPRGTSPRRPPRAGDALGGSPDAVCFITSPLTPRGGALGGARADACPTSPPLSSRADGFSTALLTSRFHHLAPPLPRGTRPTSLLRSRASPSRSSPRVGDALGGARDLTARGPPAHRPPRMRTCFRRLS